MHTLHSRPDHFVRRHPDPSPRGGQDGVDSAPGGGVCSDPALPHTAADCDGVLEVRPWSSYTTGEFDSTHTFVAELRLCADMCCLFVSVSRMFAHFRQSQIHQHNHFPLRTLTSDPSLKLVNDWGPGGAAVPAGVPAGVFILWANFQPRYWRLSNYTS